MAVTFTEMGLLADDHHRPSWYDPGRFWSGDDLDLAPGFALGGEIEVALPPVAEPAAITPTPRGRWARLPRLPLRR